ncbi:ATP synthase F1 subunit epsilon [Kozakia baliensis]|uniref:ATP synthase F1 subunit epsilon n=1 Tax=Kozakia baliensis TaxID=153496 RepID=UPI00087DD610|nr:ATP synthase F1 subunit epsilon [Kozakia baliensis]AOX20510.1 ATP synthase subunit epsilon [Kozakia baliensis]
MPIQVEIISPEKVLFRREVEMAVMPGAEGDIAAMPDHAPMMLLLRGGVVSLYEGDRIVEQFFVGGGFADMTPERCTILADEALPVAEIKVDDARSRLQELETQFANVTADDIAGQDKMSRRIQIARAEIEAAEVSHPTH